MFITTIRSAHGIPLNVNGALQSLRAPLYSNDGGIRPAAFAPSAPGTPLLVIELAFPQPLPIADAAYRLSGILQPDDSGEGTKTADDIVLFSGEARPSGPEAVTVAIPVMLACEATGFVALTPGSIRWEFGDAASLSLLGVETIALELYFLRGDPWPELRRGPAVEMLRRLAAHGDNPAGRTGLRPRSLAPESAAAVGKAPAVLRRFQSKAVETGGATLDAAKAAADAIPQPADVWQAVKTVFETPGLKYNTSDGSSGRFYQGDPLSTAGCTFTASKWNSAQTANPSPSCNCYDLALAVQYKLFLLGFKGASVKYCYAGWFGYLRTTVLKGVLGNCNNPMFTGNIFDPRQQVAPYLLTSSPMPSNRSWFDNHAICAVSYDQSPPSFAADATSGPHFGNEPLQDYFANATDPQHALVTANGLTLWDGGVQSIDLSRIQTRGLESITELGGPGTPLEWVSGVALVALPLFGPVYAVLIERFTGTPWLAAPPAAASTAAWTYTPVPGAPAGDGQPVSAVVSVSAVANNDNQGKGFVLVTVVTPDGKLLYATWTLSDASAPDPSVGWSAFIDIDTKVSGSHGAFYQASCILTAQGIFVAAIDTAGVLWSTQRDSNGNWAAQWTNVGEVLPQSASVVRNFTALGGATWSDRLFLLLASSDGHAYLAQRDGSGAWVSVDDCTAALIPVGYPSSDGAWSLAKPPIISAFSCWLEYVGGVGHIVVMALAHHGYGVVNLCNLGNGTWGTPLGMPTEQTFALFSNAVTGIAGSSPARVVIASGKGIIRPRPTAPWVRLGIGMTTTDQLTDVVPNAPKSLRATVFAQAIRYSGAPSALRPTIACAWPDPRECPLLGPDWHVQYDGVLPGRQAASREWILVRDEQHVIVSVLVTTEGPGGAGEAIARAHQYFLLASEHHVDPGTAYTPGPADLGDTAARAASADSTELVWVDRNVVCTVRAIRAAVDVDGVARWLQQHADEASSAGATASAPVLRRLTLETPTPRVGDMLTISVTCDRPCLIDIDSRTHGLRLIEETADQLVFRAERAGDAILTVIAVDRSTLLTAMENLSVTVAPETHAPEPDHAEVATLAYELWLGRGCPIGSPEEDWYRAEAELNQDRK